MLAQSSYAPLPPPISVIGFQFMAPDQFHMIVDINSSGNLVITDVNHKIMFKVKGCNSSFHRQRVLLDVYDKPIVTIRDKIKTGHGRWNVFRGYSTNESDLIFSTETPHMIQFKTSVHVFLENKTSRTGVCDFKIEGSWSQKNCAIYMGNTSTSIAQMYKMDSFVKDKFMVTIHPGVDLAFVVTLIAIVEAMKSCDKNDVPPGKEFVSGLIKLSTLGS